MTDGQIAILRKKLITSYPSSPSYVHIQPYVRSSTQTCIDMYTALGNTCPVGINFWLDECGECALLATVSGRL